MTYGSVHRFILRSVASRGVLSLEETQTILNANEGNNFSIQDVVKMINENIRPFQQTIKITNDEVTNKEFLVFISLGYDDATKSQNVFTATELQYFKLLLEKIMTIDSKQISEIYALNLVRDMKTSFTKTDAQKLLNTWCRLHYLEKDDPNYALGIRAVHEFEGFLRENLPDTIEECCLCKNVVFRGYNCRACAAAVHSRCLNHYLEKVEKWPCCKVDYSAEQLECLNSERLTQNSSQDINVQTQIEEVSGELESEDMEAEILTQDIIPEISQRVTRKRKRIAE